MVVVSVTGWMVRKPPEPRECQGGFGIECQVKAQTSKLSFPDEIHLFFTTRASGSALNQPLIKMPALGSHLVEMILYFILSIMLLTAPLGQSADHVLSHGRVGLW